MTKMFIGNGYVQYGKYSACNEYFKIEDKIEILGLCEEFANSNKNMSKSEKDNYDQQKAKLLGELKTDISHYQVDISWMTRFLKERSAYYNSEKERELGEGKEQVSPSILGQIEATSQVQQIVRDIKLSRIKGE